MVQGSLAHKLRVLRAERGLTLRDAASLSSVAKETISDIERGLRHPHDPTLAKIAKGYGVPVEDLIEEPVPFAESPKTQTPSSPAPEAETEGDESSAENELEPPDFGTAREGLERYCARWERRLAEDALSLESIEEFFETFDGWDHVLDVAIDAEFRGLIEAGRIEPAADYLENMDKRATETQLGQAGLRHMELSDKILEAAKELRREARGVERIRFDEVLQKRKEKAAREETRRSLPKEKTA